jgi:tRNA(fMet)-specific endonuclease VapC
MTYFWDTNIILHTIRNEDFFDALNKKYQFSHPLNKICISSVTVGEVHAFALRNRWGQNKISSLQAILQTLEVVSVTDDAALIKMYAEIDVYSQSKHPTLTLPTSARKMGKNDLWIAATTAVHNAVLLSTDNDFNHLDGLFIAFDKIVA